MRLGGAQVARMQKSDMSGGKNWIFPVKGGKREGGGFNRNGVGGHKEWGGKVQVGSPLGCSNQENGVTNKKKEPDGGGGAGLR